jgi:hypothetical protein
MRVDCALWGRFGKAYVDPFHERAPIPRSRPAVCSRNDKGLIVTRSQWPHTTHLNTRR